MLMNKSSILNKKRIIICIEIVLLVIAILSLFVKNKIYSVNIYDEESSLLKLAAGRYIVTVEYEETEDNICVWLSDESGESNSGKIMTHDQTLSHTKNSLSYEFWITGISENVKFNLTNKSNNTDNMGIIYSLTVEQTKFAGICAIFVLIITLIVTFFIFAAIDRVISLKNVIVVLSIICITIIASLPVFSKYIPIGFDSYFHCMRIEGIKDGLLAGQFPVKVEPTYLNGYGYAVSTFYGSIFMYIPAFLRLIGFNLQFCYKFLLIFINCMMTVSSYLFIKEVTKSKKYGLIGAVIYILSMYKFCNTFFRGAIGEVTAMAVLPFVALGLWNIYTKPFDEKYKSRWILPTLGFTGLIQSHIISTEIIGAFTVIICLGLFWKTFKKQTFLVLLKTVIFTLILNIGFLVPLFESLHTLSMLGNQWNNVNSNLQETGIVLRDIFSFQIPAFTTMVWYEQTYFIGLGFVFFIVILISIYVIFKQIINKKIDKHFLFVAIISLFSLIAVTRHFPWNSIINFFQDYFGSVGVFIANMISNIQYSYRISTVTTLFLSLLAVISFKKLENKKVAELLMVLIVSISLVQCVLLEASIIATENNSKEQILFVNEENSKLNNEIGMGEYLPMDPSGKWIDIGEINQYYTNNPEIEIIDYKKEYTNVLIKVRNNTNDTGLVTLPLYYYLGYSAKDLNTGDKIEVFKSPNGRVMFIIESGMERCFQLKYTGKPLWKVCETISLIAFFVMVFYILKQKLPKIQIKKELTT